MAEACKNDINGMPKRSAAAAAVAADADPAPRDDVSDDDTSTVLGDPESCSLQAIPSSWNSSLRNARLCAKGRCT